MDAVILILITIALVLITTLFFLNKSKKDKNENVEPNQIQQRNEPRVALENPRNIPRNRLVNRNRNARREQVVNDNVVNEDNEDNDVVGNNSDDGQDDEEREELRKKIGTKKMAKLEEKAARRERNEQMLRDREEKKEKDEQIYRERKRKEEEEERLEKEKEAEEKRLREEAEKREHEEYLKLKEQFTIEEAGEDKVDDMDTENLLQNFVEHLKKSKIVVLEDLGAEFKLKTQDVINRINLVQEMGLVTGVMDDRGKFIYISEEELYQVKRFIEQRGRVNIAELAKSSNELINMKPLNEEVSI